MLHGARDLDAALEHIQWLLAPGGLLLFEESTSWNLIYNVSNALLEGLSATRTAWRSDTAVHLDRHLGGGDAERRIPPFSGAAGDRSGALPRHARRGFRE